MNITVLIVGAILPIVALGIAMFLLYVKRKPTFHRHGIIIACPSTVPEGSPPDQLPGPLQRLPQRENPVLALVGSVTRKSDSACLT
jgi:hypothetical protein